MENYRHLFSLPSDIHYINGAYMSPLLNTVVEAGQKGILLKSNPTVISQDDFFNKVKITKAAFGKLINGDPEQVAIIPSASYAFANAFNNIKPYGRKTALTIEGEFPSGFCAMKKWCQQHNLELKVIPKPALNSGRGKIWNEELIAAIDKNTAVVLISSLHWMDGTRFDLPAIGLKCKSLDIPFIVDGTQTVGAQPVDIQSSHIDVLVAASYKWMFGPYSIGAAYFSEQFNAGIPIEDSWMNRHNAEDFANLTDYNELYEPGARKYDVGESANFILIPMMLEGLNFLLDFRVEKIAEYCAQLSAPLIDYLQENGFWVEAEAERSKHLFGFELPDSINTQVLQNKLAERKIYLSYRKKAVRVSPNIYNTEADINALINVLKSLR